MADNVFFDSSKNTGTVTLSNNNLTGVFNSNSASSRANIGRSSGKWYWEVKIDSKATGATSGVGIIDNVAFNWSASTLRGYVGSSSPTRKPDNTAYGEVFSTGDIISVLLDLDSGILEFWKNGKSLGVSNTDLKSLDIAYPIIMHGSTGNPTTATINFGATSFAYSLPMNYKSYDGSQSNVHKFLISSEDEYYSLTPPVYGTQNIIPIMTSAVSNIGEASADSYNNSDYPWNAFNGVANGSRPFWYTSNVKPEGGHWLQFNFFESKAIYKISLKTFIVTSGNYSVKDFELYASTDGIKYTMLIRGTHPNSNVRVEYSFENKEKYKYYRLNILNSYVSDINAGVDLMEMFEYTPPKLSTLLNQSEQTFINHGMNRDTSIELTTSKLIERRYIVQDNSQLDSGKVFKQKIDTTKIPIKNAIIE